MLAVGELLGSSLGTSTDCADRGLQHGYAAAAPALGEEEMLARLWLKLRGQMEQEAQLRNGKRNEGLFISEYDTFLCWFAPSQGSPGCDRTAAGISWEFHLRGMKGCLLGLVN